MTISVLSVRAASGGAEAEVRMEIADGDRVQHVGGTILAALFSETGLPWQIKTPLSIDKETCEHILFSIEVTSAIKKGLVFLDFSGYSAKRLRRKLTEKGFSGEAAKAAVEYLCSHGCINEERDAQMLAETLANRKLYGKNRIQRELFAKGFEEAVIRSALEVLDIDFAELCARRIASMGGLPCFEERAAKQKAIAALMRYGFSYDDIREGIRRLSESE